MLCLTNHDDIDSVLELCIHGTEPCHLSKALYISNLPDHFIQIVSFSVTYKLSYTDQNPEPKDFVL